MAEGKRIIWKDTDIKRFIVPLLLVLALIGSLLFVSVVLHNDEPQMFLLKYEGVSEDNSSYVVVVYGRNPEGKECNTDISCCTVVFSMYDFEMKVSDMENHSNASTMGFVDADGDGHISVGDTFYIGKDALNGKQAKGIADSEFDRDKNGRYELYMFVYSCDGKIGEIEFELPEGERYM